MKTKLPSTKPGIDAWDVALDSAVKSGDLAMDWILESPQRLSMFTHWLLDSVPESVRVPQDMLKEKIQEDSEVLRILSRAYHNHTWNESPKEIREMALHLAGKLENFPATEALDKLRKKLAGEST
jgi:hypothetical protein